MKIRTDFVTNSSSSSYVCVYIQTKDCTNRYNVCYDIDEPWGELDFDINADGAIVVEKNDDESSISANTFEELFKAIAVVYGKSDDDDDIDLDQYKNFFAKYPDLSQIKKIIIVEENGYRDSDMLDDATVEDYESDAYCMTSQWGPNDITIKKQKVYIFVDKKGQLISRIHDNDNILEVYTKDYEIYLEDVAVDEWHDDCKLYECHDATNIIIPDDITGISDEVFKGVKELVNITIPKSVRSLGENIFAGCTKLKTIKYLGTTDEWNKIKKSSKWNSRIGNYELICSDGGNDDGDSRPRPLRKHKIF